MHLYDRPCFAHLRRMQSTGEKNFVTPETDEPRVVSPDDWPTKPLFGAARHAARPAVSYSSTSGRTPSPAFGAGSDGSGFGSAGGGGGDAGSARRSFVR